MVYPKGCICFKRSPKHRYWPLINNWENLKNFMQSTTTLYKSVSYMKFQEWRHAISIVKP